MPRYDSPATRIVEALGGKNGRCNCPVEEHRTPLSLAVRDGATTSIVVHCHAGCSPLDVLRELRQRGLMEDDERRPFRPRRPQPSADRSILQYLLDLLQPISRTPVETYLRSRGLDLPSNGHHLRYLPARPPKHPWPTMAAIVTDFTDAHRILTLHLTRLAADGAGKAPLPKREQRSYLAGLPKKGGVIRLCDDADVTLRLGLAEGVETALSLTTTFRRDRNRFEPVWAALDAGNLGALPVVSGLETLVIYADRGEAGEQAANALAQRWLADDREVLVAVAPGDDWNLAGAP
jgi:putative DNA primase/helicase